MNRPAWLIGIFAITVLLIRPSYGQMAYGLSSVTYDPGSNAVDSISETELDYTAAYYYDPYVEGYLYDEANTDTPVASSASTSETWATCVPSSLAGPCLVAYVSLSAQAITSHSYDIDSEHYVIAYYQYTEPDNTVVYQDPFNFSSSFDSAGGGGDYGGSFEDTPTYSTTVYVVSEYIYLGSTGAVASTVDATPWIDSISPATFNPGTQNNVTITGGGFGQNPSLDFAPGNGLSYTIMSTTANTINLVLNIAGTAAPGSRSVDVSSNGASGQGFLPGSGVSQRSNAKTISVNGSSCLYSIPADGQKLSIGGDYLTTSIPLQVTESTNNPACTGKVRWTVTFTYHPSRGSPQSSSGTLSACGTVNQVTNLTTTPGTGGQGAVIATISRGGNVVTSIPATVYVDGISIDPNLVTQKFYALYAGGGTPGLMTGIAWKESTYQQFTLPGTFCYGSNSVIFSQTGNWPKEDCKYHGSHVGLMMIPTDPKFHTGQANQQRYGFDAMQDGYNWQLNAQHGVNFFANDKLYFAGQWEAAFLQCYPNLRPLTLAESEKDALAYYGEASPTIGSYAQKSFGCQIESGAGAYWIPDPGTNYSDWKKNTTNNDVISYVDDVENHIQH